MRRAAKNDANQPEIIAAFRLAGCAVQELNQGDGVPDLLICNRRGELQLVEVKGLHGDLTEDQHKWLLHWPGPVFIVRSVTEALSLAKG